MPRARPHLWDIMAKDIAHWVDDNKVYVDLFKDGGHAPFAALTSPDRLEAFFEKKFMQPDGSPNEEGRQQVLQGWGIKEYARMLGYFNQKYARGIPSADAMPNMTLASYPGNPPVQLQGAA